jgi:DNA-binding MarR family transcriptional regulator
VSPKSPVPSGQPVPRSGRPRLTYLIKRLERLVHMELDAAMRSHGLTVLQYAALSVLQAQPGLSSAELARRSFVTAQSMNEMVTALERRELITRTRHPGNERILQIFLTAQGEEALARCEEAADEVETRMLAGTGDAEIALLRRSVRRFTRALQGP